jgi:hypothetical protein
MGTRADFYILDESKQKTWEWLGSVAYDGHPSNFITEIESSSIVEFHNRVTFVLKDREDATISSQGWPWPWKTSHTTDYSYVYNVRLGRVVVNCFKRIIIPLWKTRSGYSEYTPFRFKFPVMDVENAVEIGKRRSGTGVIKFDGCGRVKYEW